MPSSGAGPARSLLSSFAVAISSSPPLAAASSDADDDALAESRNTPLSLGATLPSHKPTRLLMATRAERDDEEPRPSAAAPQPAPAPPSASSLPTSAMRASTAERSTARWTGASLPIQQVPVSSAASGLAATRHAWASPSGQVPPLTRQLDSTHYRGHLDTDRVAHTPFTWRTSPDPSARQASVPSTAQLGHSPPAAFTPHIRYRSNTTAAVPLSEPRTAASRQSTSPLRAAAGHQRDTGYGVRDASPAAAVPVTPSPSAWAPRTAMDTAATAPPTRWPLSYVSSTHAATPAAWPSATAQTAAKQPGLLTALAMPPPPLLLTTTGLQRQRGMDSSATSTSSPSASAGEGRVGWGAAKRSARVITLAIPEDACPAASSAPSDVDPGPRRGSMLWLSTTATGVGGARASAAASAAAPAGANGSRSPLSSHGDSNGGAEARTSPPLPHAAPPQPASVASGRDADAVCDDAAVTADAEPLAFRHLTLRSLTDEYSRFATDGTVGWVGLQVHLRRHTQSSQVVALDLTCYRMRRDQWTWFTQQIVPQLHALEVLRLVQMRLDDDAVAELVRGCCGLSTPAEGRRAANRASPLPPRPPQIPTGGGSGSRGQGHNVQMDGMASDAPLPYLRVLDLSGNALTQRSCTHLGKMMLWMAATLQEVRLLGNPLKDYGMQTLAVYVAKLNVEALEQDPALFSPALLDLYATVRKESGCGAPRNGHGCGGKGGGDDLIAGLPIGPVLLDLRDCRASARGLSDMLAAASRAHRLGTLVLSHNVAGVTALLPLPASAFRDAVELGAEESVATAEHEHRSSEVRMRETRDSSLLVSPRPTPRRLRLVKTPLIHSGALLRRQQTAFSDVAGFATTCALATLVFHGVPLSQTYSPVGCRELLLNIFFSCPQLDLVDLSDTFEWSLVPPAAQQALVAEASHLDAVEQRLRGPEVRQGLHTYRVDQGEIEFVLNSATVCEQTLLGDVFGELMAHAAFNALVRHRLVPAAFTNVRELHLSNSGLTDAGARGLCVSVRRGRHRTGMLAALTVLSLSDNLLTVRGCVRVISTFLLADDVDAEPRGSAAGPESPTAPMPIAHLTALALQRNSGVESSNISNSNTANTVAEAGGDMHVRELCAAAEAAVLLRAALYSVARPHRASTSTSSAGDGGEAVALRASDAADATDGNHEWATAVAPLTLCFSTPPPVPQSAVAAAAPSRRPSTSLSTLAAGHVEVFHAGCDERGDVYCTCPSSRLSVPKQSRPQPPSPGAAAASSIPHSRHDGGPAAHAPMTSAQPEVSSVAPPTLDNSTAVLGATQTPSHESPERSARDGGVGGAGYATARPVSSSSPPGAEHRSLLAALDVPHIATVAAAVAHHPPSPGASAAATPTGAGGRVGEESANGLVNTTSIHHLWNAGNSANDLATGPGTSLASSSFASFGPPPTSSGSPNAAAAAAAAAAASASAASAAAAAAATAAAAAAAAAEWERCATPQSGVTSPSHVSDTASLGALFIKEGGELNAAAADAAVRNAEGGGEGDVAAVPADAAGTRQGSGRRPKVRRMRTYVLSYDHPAGHLLCRVLNILLRPSPDALGDGARAALEADLLAALHSAMQASSSSAVAREEMDESAGSSTAKPARVAVIEAVHYLPPQSVAVGGGSDEAAADHDAGSGAETEAHWMGFEVTTNERKGAMAELLQEALNVSWDAQVECFSGLLEFLRMHVMGDGEGDATDAWDVVPVMERAAQASPAVRVRLKVHYSGDAVNAVHALHQYPGTADAALTQPTAERSRVRLDQVHPTLWRKLGLPAMATGASTPADTARRSSHSGARQEEGGSAGPATPASRGGSHESPMRTALSLQGDVNTAAISSPRRQQSQHTDGNSRPSSLELLSSASPPPSSTRISAGSVGRQRRNVLDFYDGVEAASVPTPSSQQPQPQEQEQRAGQLLTALAADMADSDEPLGDSRRVETPEKQHSPARLPKPGKGNGSPALTPRPSSARHAAPEADEGERVSQVQANQLQLDSPTAELVLTDQLVAPSSEPRRPPHEAALAAAGSAAALDSASREPPSNAAATSLDPRTPHAGADQLAESSSSLPPRESAPSNPPAAAASTTPEAAAAASDAGAVLTPAEDASTEPEAEGEASFIEPPIRVQRCASQLIGRVKTFTLSYTHQEGTAVCRAWRLLHLSASANRSGTDGNVSSEATAEVVTVLPTRPSTPRSLAAVAQEARRCLCNDFLAFLQPPDNDVEHAVLSVSLHGDGGVATAMLQVQVQTNERRAALADRLQHSNHGVRRGLGARGSRTGLVPLTVQEVDRYYFPRLTRLLRRYRTVADTAAQVQAYLEPRAALQERLLQSYGNVAALVHYYHGSPAALEHELGVSSWQAVADPLSQPSPPSPTPSVSVHLTEDMMSPTVAVDRVRGPAAGGAAAGGVGKDLGSFPVPEASAGDDVAEGSLPGDGAYAEDPSRSPTSQGRTQSTGRPSPPPPPASTAAAAATSRQPSRSASAGATAAATVQGRPPPHPRRPPTPPHAITHTSSITFDEITDEPTSEAGPVVVLRGSTPTPTPRSPSHSQSLNPQYFPVVYWQAVNAATPSPRSPLDDGAEGSLMPPPGASSSVPLIGALSRGGHDTDTDSGMVSPLTALSSAAASPEASHRILGLASSPLPTAPMPHRTLHLEAVDNEAPAAPLDRNGPLPLDAPAERPHTADNPDSGPLGGSGAPIPSVSSLSSIVSKVSPTLRLDAGIAPAPRAPAVTERSDDHSTASGGGGSSSTTNKNATSGSTPAAAAGAAAVSARPPKPELRRPASPAVVPSVRAAPSRRNAEYKRVLEGKYKRLMRVAYEGVAHGSVPLAPQHQQKTVLGRGKWGTQKVELSLEWEILFVLTFEKSRKIGRSSRRAQMLVHPVGFGFECVAGDEAGGHGGNRFGATGSGTFYSGDASSLHSSAVNGEAGDSMHHQPSTSPSSKTTRKKGSTRSLASHLIIHVERPFTPDEVGSSAQEMEKTLLAGALLTVSSTTSKATWLLGSVGGGGGGSDNVSNASRTSAGAHQVAQDFVDQLCQPSLTLDVEMKDSRHVQEALRLLKHSIRRATQAIEKSMLNAALTMSKP